jgi:hypothetical protein
MTTANGATRAGAVVIALAATLLLGVALAGAQPASAGGADWIVPARDRYEAGQTVVMIGYGNAGDWRAAGPFHAYLRVDPVAAEAVAAKDVIVHPSDLRVAGVIVEDVSPPAGLPWWFHRVSITFDLPPDLPPASYTVLMCNDPCTDDNLGTFWPEQVNVGVDPPYPVVRNWPLTEPMIRWLEDGALIMTPWGQEVTAADVRAGRVQAPPPPPAPATGTAAPAVEPDAPSGADATVSRSAGAEPAGGAGRTPAGAVTGRAERTDAASRSATGTDDAPDGGKATAWWIGGEVVLLVAGCAAWRYWSGRRRRRALRPVADSWSGRRRRRALRPVADEPIAGPGGDGRPPDGGPGGEPVTSVGGLVYEPDPDPDSLDGPRREPVRIRL